MRDVGEPLTPGEGLGFMVQLRFKSCGRVGIVAVTGIGSSARGD
jgi:hypothetical protein